MNASTSLSRQSNNHHDKKTALDDTARSKAPGKFIALSDGLTHYELAGPADGQPVVLVHGFSVPYYIWDHTFTPLVEAGFRVLRFDLFGRGYSDRPDVTYNADLYDRQLEELARALGIKTPVDLIGVSMGGIISTIFTQRHPELVRKVALIDPAGLQERMPFPISLIEKPVIGELMMACFGDRILISGLRGDLRYAQKYPEYVNNFMAQMQYAGFKRALLSTMRSGIIYNQQEAYRQLGQQDREILLIWGKEDQTIPFAISEQVRQSLPRADFRPIADAGHIPQFELPDQVNPLLIDFLRAARTGLVDNKTFKG